MTGFDARKARYSVQVHGEFEGRLLLRPGCLIDQTTLQASTSRRLAQALAAEGVTGPELLQHFHALRAAEVSGGAEAEKEEGPSGDGAPLGMAQKMVGAGSAKADGDGSLGAGGDALCDEEEDDDVHMV